MTTTDCATLDQVKDFMGMTGSNALIDELIEDLISRVTDMFHKYCGVDQFKSKSYTEYYSGSGTRELFTDQRPIISVESIAIDHDWIWGTDSTVASTDYAIMDDCIVLKATYFTTGTRNIKVIYTAGFATIPNDLTLACIMETARIFKRRENIDVVSKSYDGGGSVTKFMEGMLPESKRILNRYIGAGVY